MSKKKTSVNAGSAAVAKSVVSRYGAGVKEHQVAYSGVDNENGQVLKRSLKGISKAKVHPDYQKQNLKQQAGFAAEAKEVDHRRAEEAIRGKKPTTVRTDDIPGHVNDQLYDITSKVDVNGNPLSGSSAQMKFVGATPEAAAGKMLGKDYQKYIENNVKIIVPRDYYDGIKDELAKKISSLERQIEQLEKMGNNDAIAAKQARLEKCKTLDKNLQKSSVSNAEALEARKSPAWSTAKDVCKTAHGAGIEQAKTGAILGGGVSFVRNVIDVINGKKTEKEAAWAVAGDAGGAAVASYNIAFVGATIKGTAQNSSLGAVRNLSKTNLPAYIATSTLEIAKTLKSYFSGEIDGTDCLAELGEKGYGMINSAMFAAIGQLAIPIPIVGALAGSMIGYALSSASYNALLKGLTEAKAAKEERLIIENECEKAIAMIREYRTEMEMSISKYFSERITFFNDTFSEIKDKLSLGDIDGYIGGINKITKSLGKTTLFDTKVELNRLMESESKIII